LTPLLWAAAFVLVTSFLSNVSPFVGASYTLIATLELTAMGFTTGNFLLVVLFSAAGAAVAKVMIYYGAFGLKGVLQKNKNIRLIGRYTMTGPFYLVLFVAAFLPVFPFDDFIFIGAGANAASIGLMTVVTLAAKVAKSFVEIFLEFTVLSGVAGLLGSESLLVTGALTAVFLVLGVVIFLVDWERVLVKKRMTVGTPSGSAKAL
jgi:hypothetical protein